VYRILVLSTLKLALMAGNPQGQGYIDAVLMTRYKMIDEYLIIHTEEGE